MWAVIDEGGKQHQWKPHVDSTYKSLCGYTYWNYRLTTPRTQPKCKACEKQMARTVQSSDDPATKERT